MPNLEYSVKFVLASDATAEIDEALRKMRETGSTINIKVNVDSSSVSNSLKSVETELKKIEEGSQKLGGSADKSTKQFNKLSNEIRKAATEFKATGEIQDKARDFEILGKRVEDYGARLRDAGRDLDTYFQLKNKLAEAEKTHTNEMNNSKLVLDARAKAEAFLAKQQRAANRELTDNTRGTIAELRRLSVEGKGSAEQITRLFGRAVMSAEDLEITTTDLTQAYASLRTSIEGSNLSYKTRQTLLNSIKVAEEQSAQSMRVMNRGLAQQQNQVGDVSYAMMSFTRLLEDVPYGFRGFANNIQPTIFGLVQLNEKTIAAAESFRKVHGKEMPLMQRAMLNLKTAFTGPINQVLLLTSVIAVAGTFIERWTQQTKKAKEESTRFADELTKLFEVAKKGGNALTFTNKTELANLEAYNASIKVVISEIEKRIKAQTALNGANAIGVGRTNEEIASQRAIKAIEETRLARAQGLSESVKKRLDDLKVEQDILNLINESEYARNLLNTAQLRNRFDTARVQAQSLEDQIKIEEVRQQKGEQAAIAKKRDLAIERLKSDELATQADLNQINLQYQLDMLNFARKENGQRKDIINKYKEMETSLKRQLENEQERTTLAQLNIDKERELEDMRAQVAERIKEGEQISEEQAQHLYDLIEQRYNLLEGIAELESEKIVRGLVEQVELSEMAIQIEQKRLLKDNESVIALESKARLLENQKGLANALAEIALKDFATEADRKAAIARTTEEFRNQYQLALLISQLREKQTIEDFLRPITSEEDDVRNRAEEARLANLAYYTAEQDKIKENAKLSDIKRAEELIRAKEEFDKIEQQITDKSTKEIANIRFRNQTEGILMVTGALEQFIGGMEASSKKQFENQKRLAIGLALLNTYLSVTQVLRDDTIKPSWLKYPAAAAMFIQGMAQVNSIRNTKYGGSASGGGVSGGRPSQQEGFQEIQSTQNAMAGVGATMNPQIPVTNITVVGNVDREGIAFAVREGENMISSRATFAR